MIFVDAGEVLVTFDVDAVLMVLLDPVVLDHSVGTQAVLGVDVYTVLVVRPDLVHKYDRVCTLRHDSRFTLRYFAQLYLSFAASLNFDPRSVHVFNYTPENLWLRIDTL